MPTPSRRHGTHFLLAWKQVAVYRTSITCPLPAPGNAAPPASPAFIEELFRKAALMAAERGEKSDPMKLTNADFDDAIRELVEFGGSITQHLLGYRNDPDSARGGLGFRAG